jgi:hypothetical protein
MPPCYEAPRDGSPSGAPEDDEDDAPVWSALAGLENITDRS